MNQQHFVAAGEVLVEIGSRLRREGHGRRAANVFQVGQVLAAKGFRYLGQTGLGLEVDTSAFGYGEGSQIDDEVGLGRRAATVLQIKLNTIFAVEHELSGHVAAVPVFHGRHSARVVVGSHLIVDEQTGLEGTTGRGVVGSSRAPSFAGGNHGTVRR